MLLNYRTRIDRERNHRLEDIGCAVFILGAILITISCIIDLYFKLF